MTIDLLCSAVSKPLLTESTSACKTYSPLAAEFGLTRKSMDTSIRFHWVAAHEELMPSLADFASAKTHVQRKTFALHNNHSFCSRRWQQLARSKKKFA